MSKTEVENTKRSQPGAKISVFDWLLLAGVIASFPLMLVEMGNLWARPHFQFFPIVWIAVPLMLARRAELTQSSSFPRLVGASVLFSISMAGFVIAVFRFSPWQAHLMLTLHLFAWALVRLSKTPTTNLLAMMALLATTLPLPFGLDVELVQTLQSWSSKSSSALLDLLGIPHLLKGNAIQVEKGELFVDEACSGIGSLYALTAITLLLLIIQKKPALAASCVLASIPGWAWAGNVIRITLIAWLYQNWDVNLLHGWQHSTFGIIVFGVIFGSVASMIVVIEQLARRIPNAKEWPHRIFNAITKWPKENDIPIENAVSLVNLTTSKRLLVISACVVWVGLGVLSVGPLLGIGPWKKREITAGVIDLGQVDSVFSQSSLPERLGDFTLLSFDRSQREFGHYLGEFSCSWGGTDGVTQILVSLDFPFVGYHTLEQCYVHTGCRIDRYADVQDSTQLGGDEIHEAQLRDQYEQPSTLFYVLFEVDGEPVLRSSKLMDKLFPSLPSGLVYQIQIYLPNRTVDSEEERMKYRKLLLDVKNRLVPLLEQLRNQ